MRCGVLEVCMVLIVGSTKVLPASFFRSFSALDLIFF